MQDVPLLPEVVVEVTDLEGGYGGDWKRVEGEVQGINRTNEDWRVATRRVHVVVRDRSVREVGYEAFRWCANLVKVTAPFVEEVVDYAFSEVYNLCNVAFGPNVVVKPRAFLLCCSLEVLAASVGFELDTGDKDFTGRNNPTVAITSFAKWHNQTDDNKE